MGRTSRADQDGRNPHLYRSAMPCFVLVDHVQRQAGIGRNRE